MWSNDGVSVVIADAFLGKQNTLIHIKGVL